MRVLRWVTVATMVSGMLAVAPPALALGFAVTIVSPLPDTVVAGRIDVALHIDVTGSTPAYSVSVNAVGDEIGQVTTMKIPAGSCDTTCDVTVPLDLGSPGLPRHQGPAISDGPIQLQAWVTTDQVASVPLVLDNQRPTLTCLSDPLQTDYCTTQPVAGDATSMTASVGAAAGGSPLVSVTYTDFFGHVAALSPTGTGSTWSGSADASTWSSGRMDGWFTATDTRGVSAVLLNATTTVDRALIVTGPTWPGSVPDDLGFFPIQVGHQGGLTGLLTAHFDVQVDGLETNSGSLYVGPMPPQPDPQTVNVYASGLRALPVGDHHMTVTATDVLGATGSWSTLIHVTPTMTGVVGTSAGSALHLGTTVAVTGSFSTSHGTLAQWRVGLDGGPPGSLATGPICFSSCPTTASPSFPWTPTTYGVHTLTWTVAVDGGATHTFSTQVQVLPDASAILRTPVPTVPGHRQAFTAHARLVTGAYADGATLTLQYSPLGSTAWTDISSLRADASGSATFLPTARRTGRWRVTTADAAGRWLGRAGSVITVRAKPAVSLAASVGRPGKVYTSTHVAYAPPHATVRLQIRKPGRWYTIAFGQLDAKGYFRRIVYLAHGHLWALRVYVPATAGSTLAISAVRTIRS